MSAATGKFVRRKSRAPSSIAPAQDVKSQMDYVRKLQGFFRGSLVRMQMNRSFHCDVILSELKEQSRIAHGYWNLLMYVGFLVIMVTMLLTKRETAVAYNAERAVDAILARTVAHPGTKYCPQMVNELSDAGDAFCANGTFFPWVLRPPFDYVNPCPVNGGRAPGSSSLDPDLRRELTFSDIQSRDDVLDYSHELLSNLLRTDPIAGISLFDSHARLDFAYKVYGGAVVTFRQRLIQNCSTSNALPSLYQSCRTGTLDTDDFSVPSIDYDFQNNPGMPEAACPPLEFTEDSNGHSLVFTTTRPMPPDARVFQLILNAWVRKYNWLGPQTEEMSISWVMYNGHVGKGQFVVVKVRFLFDQQGVVHTTHNVMSMTLMPDIEPSETPWEVAFFIASGAYLFVKVREILVTARLYLMLETITIPIIYVKIGGWKKTRIMAHLNSFRHDRGTEQAMGGDDDTGREQAHKKALIAENEMLDEHAELTKRLQFMRSAWFFLDWLNLLLYVSMIANHRNLVQRSLDLEKSVDQFPEVISMNHIASQFASVLSTIVATQADIDGVVRDVDLYFQMSSFTVFVSLLRLFRYLQFQPRLNTFTETLQKGLVDIAHFLVVYIMILVMFTVITNLLFGVSVEQFSTFEGAAFRLFDWNIGNFGDDDDARVFELFPWTGTIVFFVYVTSVFLVVLNLFLAIVLESYGVVRAKTVSSPSIAADLKAIVQYLVRYAWHIIGHGMLGRPATFATRPQLRAAVHCVRMDTGKDTGSLLWMSAQLKKQKVPKDATDRLCRQMMRRRRPIKSDHSMLRELWTDLKDRRVASGDVSTVGGYSRAGNSSMAAVYETQREILSLLRRDHGQQGRAVAGTRSVAKLQTQRSGGIDADASLLYNISAGATTSTDANGNGVANAPLPGSVVPSNALSPITDDELDDLLTDATQIEKVMHA